MIRKSTLEFLADLRTHNNRDWFEAHRDDYLAARANVVAFAEAVTAALNQTDVIDQYRVYRIYRDLRFTKDRSRPYKEHFGGYFRRAGAQRRGGYVFRIGTNGNSQVGGGFFGPNQEDLRRIRQELAFDSNLVEEIAQQPDFVRYFDELQGEAVKTVPRGFDKDHPSITWLRRKQFYALRSFTDREVLHPNFVAQTVATFRALRPFFNYMSEVLTTNANGERKPAPRRFIRYS
jgi:uncharacterized protein (TIGR02453 family)